MANVQKAEAVPFGLVLEEIPGDVGPVAAAPAEGTGLQRVWEPPRSTSPGFTQAFRLLALDIEQMAASQQLRSIVVASAYPADGRTTTAVNLGLSLAEIGKRVLLVESPGGRTSISKQLGAQVGPGTKPRLVNIFPSSFVGISVAVIDTSLAGRSSRLSPLARLGDGIQRTLSSWRRKPAHGAGAQLLTIIAGLIQDPASAEPRPAEQEDVIPLMPVPDVDFVIFDSPPCLRWSDAFFLGGRADGILYVVRRRRQDPRGQHSIQTQFARVGAKVIGAVFNEG